MAYKNQPYYRRDQKEFKVSPKSEELMRIYIDDEFLTLSTGVRLCMNVNSLNYKEIENLYKVIERHIPGATSRVRNDDRERLIWLPVEGTVNAGESYEKKFQPIINEFYKYVGEEEERRIDQYGTISVGVDFGKIRELDPEILKSCGYGFAVVTDFVDRNKGHDFPIVARMRFGQQNPKNTNKLRGKEDIMSIFALKDQEEVCFKRRATIIIYYVKEMVEKSPDTFFPKMTIITIPLYVSFYGDSFSINYSEITKTSNVEIAPVEKILETTLYATRTFRDATLNDKAVRQLLDILGVHFTKDDPYDQSQFYQIVKDMRAVRDKWLTDQQIKRSQNWQQQQQQREEPQKKSQPTATMGGQKQQGSGKKRGCKG